MSRLSSDRAKTRQLINRVIRQNLSTLMFTHKLVCANLARNFHNHLADDSHRICSLFEANNVKQQKFTSGKILMEDSQSMRRTDHELRLRSPS